MQKGYLFGAGHLQALAGFDPSTIADGLGELHEVLLGLVALHRGELHEVRRRLDEPRSNMQAQLARPVLRSALQRSQRSARVWVSRNGTRVVLPDGTQIDLTRRGVLRRILVQLVTRRLEAPGEPQSVEAVLGAGWPDEQMQYEAGVNRVYVSISRLRSAGLGPLVQQREGGYLLDPARPVSWHEAR